jgi:hypothetical protein
MSGLCIAAAGCTSEEDRAASASRALARSLAMPDSEPVAASTGASPGVPKLYLDATQSMAGFVGCGQSRTFDAILARTATDLGITHVWLFGEPSDGSGALLAEHPLNQSVYCTETYSRRHNPDFALVEAIQTDTESAVHIYFTDGVQSAVDGPIPSPSVRALQGWISGGRALAILAFRGTFSGRAWSEEGRRWTGTASVEKRPFYAFVLARSEPGVERVLERLSQAVRQRAVVLRVTGAFPRCSVQPARQHYAKMESPPWVMLPPSLTRRLGSGRAEVGVYECQIPREFPLESVPTAIAATYGRWQGADFSAPLGALPSGVSFASDSVLISDVGSRVVLTAGIPDDKSTRFGFYALELRAVPGRLRASVDSLSTETDASLATYEQTYRFGWMLEHLVRSEFERRALRHPYFLTVQYR